MAPDGSPNSWRDVYSLVRDTRLDVLAEVNAVRTDVTAIRASHDKHMLEHAEMAGSKKAQSLRITAVRTFITTVLPVPAMLLAILALLQR